MGIRNLDYYKKQLSQAVFSATKTESLIQEIYDQGVVDTEIKLTREMLERDLQKN